MFLITLLGLVIGSFLGALTYRLSVGVSIAKGRSFCPKCKAKISWYDNIPLLSYLLLSGKCRSCGKKISIREPLIELSTAILFILVVVKVSSITEFYIGTYDYFIFSFIYLLVLVSVMFALLIVDWEHQILPDSLVFMAFLLVAVYKVLTHDPNLYSSLLGGFLAASFLLTIHLLTKGRGMGLGDVKLAVTLGMFMGLTGMFVWLFGSFVLGAFTGIVLIILKNKKMKDQIAFGPFLVISFFLFFFYPQLVVTAINSLIR